MQSHIRKQQILFHRQFKDKQEFEKRNKQIVIHRHIFMDIPYTQTDTIVRMRYCLLRYYLPPFFFNSIYAIYEYHLCLTNIFCVLIFFSSTSFFFLVSFRFPLAKFEPNDVGRHAVKWIICDCHTSVIHFNCGFLTVSHCYCIVWTSENDKCIEKLLQFFFFSFAQTLSRT